MVRVVGLILIAASVLSGMERPAGADERLYASGTMTDPEVSWGGGDEGPLWHAFTSWSFRPSDDRMLGDGQLFVPLWQDGTTLLFADIRGKLDDSENIEGNWGLAARTLYGDEQILGLYAFYDRLWTENDNAFDQGTFGLELLALDWEFRVNGYVPDVNPRRLGTAGLTQPQAELSNGVLVLRSGGDVQEVALYGVDAEYGELLLDWHDGDVEWRAFIGGFHFDNDTPGVPNVSGPRVRTELRIYDLDWLGEGSRVTFGGDFHWDQVRGSQAVAMLQVRIPLCPGRQRPLSRLERRMLDTIVRDVDVITLVHQNPEIVELAVDAATGMPLGPVSVVDANTADIPSAVATGAPTVIADGTHGQLDVTAPIVLRNGQTFRGGGFTLAGAMTGRTATFGMRPTINGTDPLQDVVVVADNSTVRDLQVTGGMNGIASGSGGTAAVSGVTIRNNHVSGAAANGFRFGDLSGSSLLTGNTAANNMQNGFQFGSIGAGSTVSNNTSDANLADGFFVGDVAGAFSGNAAHMNSAVGFHFTNVGTGGAVSGNTAEGNLADGFMAGDIAGTFSNNTATANQMNGFLLGGITGAVTGNTAGMNAVDGLVAGDLGAGGMFSNNTSVSNAGRGFVLGNVSGTAANNSARMNAGDGFRFQTVSTGGAFRNNMASGNLASGIVLGDVAGMVNGNLAAMNAGHGFVFQGVTAGGAFSTNAANSNMLNGFQFGSVDGAVSGNTAGMNGGDGFNFAALNAGTVGGNTATMNGGAGFHFSGISAGATFSNNAGSSNALDGFSMGSIDGSATGNIATTNGGDGFEFLDVGVGGTFSNNVANGNIAAGYNGGVNLGTAINNTGMMNGSNDTYP